MIGSLVAVPLPSSVGPRPASSFEVDPLQTWLWDEHRIQALTPRWPAWPSRLLRASVHGYTHRGDLERLARAVADGLKREQS
jgi:hypothetical protein